MRGQASWFARQRKSPAAKRHAVARRAAAEAQPPAFGVSMPDKPADLRATQVEAAAKIQGDAGVEVSSVAVDVSLHWSVHALAQVPWWATSMDPFGHARPEKTQKP
jgi:hypothetical protein